ncbi:hypothetical protein ACET3Z_007224 [Daucus carota]
MKPTVLVQKFITKEGNTLGSDVRREREDKIRFNKKKKTLSRWAPTRFLSPSPFICFFHSFPGLSQAP